MTQYDRLGAWIINVVDGPTEVKIGMYINDITLNGKASLFFFQHETYSVEEYIY